NPDRVSPPPAAAFTMMMLATTERGDAYTFAEYERMFRSAGFVRCEHHPIPPSLGDVILAYA
ncbi:MAG: methyltransferase type 12, partial [Acidobacteria bacterium]|nr:methyltransferase type 12 [Acidobacteriota bacterium]